MSKGAVGLTAGYWPEDIYRYLAIPGLSLDEGVVVRPSRRRPDRPALVGESQALSYRQLSTDVERAAKLLRNALGPEANRVALVVQDVLETARLFLGGLKARAVVLLPDPFASGEELGEQMRSFRPDLVMVEDSAGSDLATWSRGNWRTISTTEFWQGTEGRAPVPRMDLKAPSVAMVGVGQRLVYHSHTSLVAWAVSWSAFVPLTEDSVVLTMEPVHRWGGMAAMLAVLFRGGTCVFTRAQSAPDLATLVQAHSPGYLVLPLERAAALASPVHAGLREVLRRTVQGAFTTVEGPFSVRERRRVESGLGVPVLTWLGSVAAGPVLASHPSWYLDEAVGIPVTNVDVWPMNPTTHEPLLVPWEAIEYGEVGARSPMVVADFHTPEDREDWVRGDWVRMGVVATMDPNGLFYLRP